MGGWVDWGGKGCDLGRALGRGDHTSTVRRWVGGWVGGWVGSVSRNAMSPAEERAGQLFSFLLTGLMGRRLEKEELSKGGNEGERGGRSRQKEKEGGSFPHATVFFSSSSSSSSSSSFRGLARPSVCLGGLVWGLCPPILPLHAGRGGWVDGRGTHLLFKSQDSSSSSFLRVGCVVRYCRVGCVVRHCRSSLLFLSLSHPGLSFSFKLVV